MSVAPTISGAWIWIKVFSRLRALIIPNGQYLACKIDAILAKLIDIYQVRLITQNGLRYKDIISKGPLGLGNRS